MKYNYNALDTFAKAVADYMDAPGEAIVTMYNPGIPLREEVNSVGLFSDKNLKEKVETRLKFDLGVIWGIALIVVRDELSLNVEQHLHGFMSEALKRTSNFGFNENPSIIYRLIEKADNESQNLGDTHPFNMGVMFSEIFLHKFYEVKFPPIQ